MAPSDGDAPPKDGGAVVKPAQKEPSTDSFTKSISASMEPMREEQVQNAVKFLSHPKVRGSPVSQRRSFLEKKGLTRQEIDEAFRRVPDAASNIATSPAYDSNQVAMQTPTSTNSQPQTALQPASAATGVATAMSTYRSRWSYALFALGIIAASGVGIALLFKKVLLPRFKAWVCKVVREENDAVEKEIQKQASIEEATEAAKSAASAVAIVAKTSQDLLNARTEEGKHFEAFKDLLSAQMEEMKSMRVAINKLENASKATDPNDEWTREQQFPSGNGHLTSASTYASPSSAFYSNHTQDLNGIPQPREVSQRDQRNQYLGYPPQTMVNAYPPTSVDGYSQINGKSMYTSEPAWQQKRVSVTGLRPDVAEEKTIPYSARSWERPGAGWVPPKPPSVANPEAVGAMRQPKSAALKQQIESARQQDISPKSVVPAEHSMVQEEVTEDRAVETSILASEAGSYGPGATNSCYSEIEEQPVDAVGVH